VALAQRREPLFDPCPEQSNRRNTERTRDVHWSAVIAYQRIASGDERDQRAEPDAGSHHVLRTRQFLSDTLGVDEDYNSYIFSLPKQLDDLAEIRNVPPFLADAGPGMNTNNQVVWRDATGRQEFRRRPALCLGYDKRWIVHFSRAAKRLEEAEPIADFVAIRIANRQRVSQQSVSRR
jgi:hypothetical protein